MALGFIQTLIEKIAALKIGGGTDGNLVTRTANGDIQDSGKKVVTALSTSDNEVPTAKAVKDVTDTFGLPEDKLDTLPAGVVGRIVTVDAAGDSTDSATTIQTSGTTLGTEALDSKVPSSKTVKDYITAEDDPVTLAATTTTTDTLGLVDQVVTVKPATTGNAGAMTTIQVTKLNSIETGAKDDQSAAEVPNTPAGNLVATNVQDAVNELQGDIDGLGTGTHTQNSDTILDEGNANEVTAAQLKTDQTKLGLIEDLADVTDSTNVAAAGAVMEADASTASMSFVIDEDDMASDSPTKIPTQQSVKAYADAIAAAAGKDNAEVTQATHGFVVKDVLYNNAGVWTKAQADDADTLGIAIVIAVEDVNNFTYATYGNQTVTAHGLTVGEYYFTSAGTAGLLSLTAPDGLTDYSNPVCFIPDANTITILPWRPSQALDRAKLAVIPTSAASYNATRFNELILVDATAGDKVVNLLPPAASSDGLVFNVKKIDSSVNIVTIKSATGNLDDTLGTTGKELTSQNQVLTFVCDGTNYFII